MQRINSSLPATTRGGGWEDEGEGKPGGGSRMTKWKAAIPKIRGLFEKVAGDANVFFFSIFNVNFFPA